MTTTEIQRGEITDIREFDRCLSAAEVAAIYSAEQLADDASTTDPA